MPEETPAPTQAQEQTTPTAGTQGTQAVTATAGTFTQEQVNQFAGKAREEGRNSAIKAVLDKYGVKSEDELLQVVEAHRKAEADKLSEVEKVNKQLAEAQAERERLAKENQELKLRGSFAETVRALNLEFVSEIAAQKAFAGLDTTLEMKEAVKKLHVDEPYYFKTIEVPELDATKKSKTTGGELTDAQKDDIRKRFRPS